MIEHLAEATMANIGDETDEELTGPSGATASAQQFGPQLAQPVMTNPFQPTSPTNAGSEIASIVL